MASTVTDGRKCTTTAEPPPPSSNEGTVVVVADGAPLEVVLVSLRGWVLAHEHSDMAAIATTKTSLTCDALPTSPGRESGSCAVRTRHHLRILYACQPVNRISCAVHFG